MVDKTRLICFPYAGGSSIAYQPWKRYLGEQFQLHPVDYPGHGSKGDKPFADNIEQLAAFIYEDIKAEFYDSDYILFGHSMGAWVAYEVYREIIKHGAPKPLSVIVSGRGAPYVTVTDEVFLCGNQLNWDAIAALGGIQAEVVENERYRKHFGTLLKSDFQMLLEYRFVFLPIEVPVFVFWGKDDRTVSFSQLIAWEKLAVRGIRVASFYGDHFYCFDAGMKEVISYINVCL